MPLPSAALMFDAPVGLPLESTTAIPASRVPVPSSVSRAAAILFAASCAVVPRANNSLRISPA